MPKLSDFKKLYDPSDMSCSTKDKQEKAKLASAASMSAMRFFLAHPRSAMYQATSPTEDPQFLFSVDHIFGRVVPTPAKFIGFTKLAEAGFFSLSATKELKLIEPETAWGEDNVFTEVAIETFYNGKTCAARDDNGNKWDCKITISEAAWSSVISQQSAADPATIKGILSNNPIWISPISKKKGDRCIKPEPYGWIFSTNGSVRLIDPTTVITNTRPAALNFTKVDNVK